MPVKNGTEKVGICVLLRVAEGAALRKLARLNSDLFSCDPGIFDPRPQGALPLHLTMWSISVDSSRLDEVVGLLKSKLLYFNGKAKVPAIRRLEVHSGTVDVGIRIYFERDLAGNSLNVYTGSISRTKKLANLVEVLPAFLHSYRSHITLRDIAVRGSRKQLNADCDTATIHALRIFDSRTLNSIRKMTLIPEIWIKHAGEPWLRHED